MLDNFYNNIENLEDDFDLKNVEQLNKVYLEQENNDDWMKGLTDDEIDQSKNMLSDKDTFSLDNLSKEELEEAKRLLEEYENEPKGLK